MVGLPLGQTLGYLQGLVKAGYVKKVGQRYSITGKIALKSLIPVPEGITFYFYTGIGQYVSRGDFENWIDKYFSRKGLIFLADSIDPSNTKEIKILTSTAKATKKLRDYFKDFKEHEKQRCSLRTKSYNKPKARTFNKWQKQYVDAFVKKEGGSRGMSPLSCINVCLVVISGSLYASYLRFQNNLTSLYVQTYSNPASISFLALSTVLAAAE